METDWKKKYEEALERARASREEAIEKEYVNDYVKDYEAIFPELAESEGEKTRKEIVSFIKDFWVDHRYSVPQASKWLDWLERQKDSPMPEDTVIFRKGVAEGRRLEREDNKREWSEQDIQCYDAVMDMITNALYLPCRPRAEIVEWFKSLKNRGNSLKSNTNSPSWSEEDDAYLKWLCRIIHSQVVNKKLSLEEESKLGNWMDKWLNHKPQSHWKPSEEQMDALNALNCNGALSYVGQQNQLISLYNDLEKLM